MGVYKTERVAIAFPGLAESLPRAHLPVRVLIQRSSEMVSRAPIRKHQRLVAIRRK